MTPTRNLHLPVAAQSSLDDLVGLVERGERRGYDAAYLPETWGRDAVTTLALAAERTDRIGLGSSVLNVYSRSPALVGATAATLQEAASGRFRLGLGPSGPAVVEHWHGEPFDRPLRRTREFVEIVRAVLSGDPVSYDGECFELDGFRLRFEPPDPAPPVAVAGMGPKAVELAGRFADGWHALFFTPDGFEDRLDDLRRGAERGGRAAADVRTTLSLPCCVLPDGERARELASRHVAFYVGGMGSFYRDALARQGYGDLAADVAAAWRRGDRAEAAEQVDSDLLDAVAVAGTSDRAMERLAEFEAIDGLDAVAISTPRGADRSVVVETVDALAPDGPA